MILVKGIYNVCVNNVFIINVFNYSIKKIKINKNYTLSNHFCWLIFDSNKKK